MVPCIAALRLLSESVKTEKSMYLIKNRNSLVKIVKKENLAF